MKITKFDFDKDWHLVEPHLNDPEVAELLDQGMLRFSLRDDKWNHLPLWDVEHGVGPWDYTKFDTHHTYAYEKQMEDPEYHKLLEEYYSILKDRGVDLDNLVLINDLYQDSDDVKINEANLIFQEKFERIYSKYLPKINTYRWYQCYGAADYLCDWSKKLAEKTFPNYKWKIFRKYAKKIIPQTNTEIMSGCTTTIGKNENDFLIFDIFLFNDSSVDEILEAVGVNRGSITEEFS